jgi:hypothetical protein
VPVPTKCVFCGGLPLEQEHVLGNWMNRRLPMSGKQRHFIGAIPGVVRSYESDQHDQTVPCVDGRCNNGWMSNLEDRFAPFLSAVATELAAQFPDRAHLLAALWAVTRAMVQQYQEESSDPALIPPEQYAHVYRTLRPPPATYVYRMSKRLAFRVQGHGVQAMDGVTLSKFITVLDVSNASVAVELGWQARVSKGAVHLGIASLCRLPTATDQLARQVFQDDEPIVQIWPLQTRVNQIRVRHPRPHRSR